jgi:hypothetical protein
MSSPRKPGEPPNVAAVFAIILIADVIIFACVSATGAFHSNPYVSRPSSRDVGNAFFFVLILGFVSMVVAAIILDVLTSAHAARVTAWDDWVRRDNQRRAAEEEATRQQHQRVVAAAQLEAQVRAAKAAQLRTEINQLEAEAKRLGVLR